MYAEGVPTPWIAEDYGVSNDTLREFARRRGITHADSRGQARLWGEIRPRADLAMLHRLFAPGLSTVAVREG